MLRYLMFEKQSKKAQDWLYPADFREYHSLLSTLDPSPDFLDQQQKEHLAKTLEYSRSFDYDLIATGEEVDRAITKVKELLTGFVFNKPANKQLVCLLSNLYLTAKQARHQMIFLQLRRGKAVPPIYNPSKTSHSMLEKIVKAMASHDLIIHVPGNFAREAGIFESHLPRIAAFSDLIEVLEEQCGWHAGLLNYHEKAETIHLKSEKDKDKKRHLITYEVTKDIAEQCELLRQYNRFIMNQRVMIPDLSEMVPDLIHTRRVFNNNSWQSHGRLYGGRFQQLNETERSKLTINGEPVVELDIKSCHPTMAYAEMGIDWYRQSNRDIYEATGVSEWPRDLVKKCVNILLNAKNKRAAVSSLNNAQRKDNIVEMAGIVPSKGWATKLVDDCFGSFADIQPLFYAERGNHYMYQEGNICMFVIRSCLEQNIPVLTLHDSFICQAKNEKFVKNKIETAFENVAGASCIIV